MNEELLCRSTDLIKELSDKLSFIKSKKVDIEYFKKCVNWNVYGSKNGNINCIQFDYNNRGLFNTSEPNIHLNRNEVLVLCDLIYINPELIPGFEKIKLIKR